MKEQNKGISDNISHIFTQVRIWECGTESRHRITSHNWYLNYIQIDPHPKHDKKSQFILQFNDFIGVAWVGILPTFFFVC